QPRMPLHRDPLPGCIEIGFGGYRVLIVRQIVANIRQQLDQRDAEVRNVPFLPTWHRLGEPIEHQLAEAGVVSREVIDLRIGDSAMCPRRPRLRVDLYRLIVSSELEPGE